MKTSIKEKIKKWRSFMKNEMCEDNEEYIRVLSEFEFDELSSINELEKYGLTAEDVEIVVRLRKEKHKQ